MKKLVSFLREEDGVTAIEYGVIAALVSIVIIAALQVLGPKLQGTFNTIQAALP